MAERFVIVNDYDRPYSSLVAEFVPGVGYCYMDRVLRPELKRFDGMEPKRPTSMTVFGFDAVVEGSAATFTRVSEGVATYKDGMPRTWDERRISVGSSFSLPLVRDAKKRRKARHAC